MNDPVQVYAAGSLREVLTEIARDHEARTGQKTVLTFAASGLLRERIEKGEAAQVFASGRRQRGVLRPAGLRRFAAVHEGRHHGDSGPRRGHQG
jgi:hypothetical protein